MMRPVFVGDSLDVRGRGTQWKAKKVVLKYFTWFMEVMVDGLCPWSRSD